MADKLHHGQRVKVLLTETHGTPETDDDTVIEHAARFIRMHRDGEWAVVELDLEHRGNSRLLSVPLSRIVAAVLLLFLLAVPVRAQFIGYTSPQTVNQQIFNAVNTTQVSPLSNASPSACNAIPIGVAACAIPNLGQSIHYVTVRVSATANFRLTLEGSNDGSAWFAMAESSSDSGLNGASPGFSGFFASGSFNAYRLNLQVGTISGTMQVWYSGTSVSTGAPGGDFNASAAYRRILALAPNSALTLTAITKTIYPPAGNTAGTVYFKFVANPCATGSLLVSAGSDTQHLSTLATIIPANNTNLQTFLLPASNAPVVTFGYTQCGTETYDTFMVFSPQGGGAPTNTFTHVTTTTATSAKGTAGFLHTVNVNTAAAGTVSIFDLATAACTGTPATNIVAVITVPAATNGLPPFLYDVNLVNGICVKSSVAMDYTVSTN